MNDNGLKKRWRKNVKAEPFKVDIGEVAGEYHFIKIQLKF